MFAHIIVVLYNAALCYSFAEFEMFPGFDVRPSKFDSIESTSTTTQETQTNATIITEPPDFTCPENEKPLNIGAYEVPSERDLVLLVKKTLMRKFQSYNKKALYLLRDIKEASKVALLTKKCPGNQNEYRICVKTVNHHYSYITKKLMSTVEDHKRNITFFTEQQVCNMAAMVTDPIVLVKMLAAEEVTLKFALPAFLKLLSDCQLRCRDYSVTKAKKPSRRLSDQEFLVKHILSNKADKRIKLFK